MISVFHIVFPLLSFAFSTPTLSGRQLVLQPTVLTRPAAVCFQYVSPALMNARDLQLAIPGSYVPHMPIIRIARVKSTLTVFSTKQRPRKVTMRGAFRRWAGGSKTADR